MHLLSLLFILINAIKILIKFIISDTKRQRDRLQRSPEMALHCV